MRMLTFANRTFKEIIRDPLTVAFGLGFPLVVLLLLTAIQANVPVALCCSCCPRRCCISQ